MGVAHTTDDDERGRRNGHPWVDAQAVMDELYKPLENLLVDAVSADRPRHVLDVGCGTGGTTVAVARRLGADARCVGIDISDPMIAAAEARAAREGAQARFIRFGVMFFDDSVRAFANLRRAATGDARLHFVAWRSAAENPFMTTAERAAAPLLPNLPPRRPDAPGQFAFAKAVRVQRILEESGWTGIDIRPIDVACCLPERELVGFFTRFGPLGPVLPEADERTRARVVETVRAAFDPYVHGPEVRFTAACWTVTARPR